MKINLWLLERWDADSTQYYPVMISFSGNKLRKLAPTLPGFYDKGGPGYTLYKLPLNTMLAGLFDGKFTTLLGAFHHEHLNDQYTDPVEEDDDGLN